MPFASSFRTALVAVVALLSCAASDTVVAGPQLVSPDAAAELAPSAAITSWPVLEANRFELPTFEEPAQFSASGSLPSIIRAQSPSPSISLIPLSDGEAPIEQTSLLGWATGTTGRLRADYLTDFGGTDRIGVQALTKTWLGIGIDTEANYWQRPVPNVGIEPLWTGDLNLIYSAVPHPRFKLRSGMGAAWRIEDGKPHAGYNITHGLDVYLLWRFMFTGEIDWGAIDDDKLFRYRAGLGLTWQGLEFFTGYDRYKLGSERIDGWMNGVQFWY